MERGERRRERRGASERRGLPEDCARSSNMRTTTVRAIADTERECFMHNVRHFRGVVFGVLRVDPPASDMLMFPITTEGGKTVNKEKA